MERRRAAWTELSPIDALRRLPALVILDRLPVAVLAVALDGTIVYANAACAEMLGYDAGELSSRTFTDVFSTMPDNDSAVTTIHAYENVIVELAHQDGHTVLALMSKSALMREQEAVALVAFHDLTEQLWLGER